MQATQLRVASVVAWPSGTNVAHVTAKTPGILMAFSDDRSHSHQHRPQLRQGRRPRHAFGSSPGLEVNMTSGGKQASLISPFCAAFVFLDLPLPTGHRPFCFSISFIPHHILAHSNGADHQAPKLADGFSSPPWVSYSR